MRNDEGQNQSFRHFLNWLLMSYLAMGEGDI